MVKLTNENLPVKSQQGTFPIQWQGTISGRPNLRQVCMETTSTITRNESMRDILRKEVEIDDDDENSTRMSSIGINDYSGVGLALKSSPKAVTEPIPDSSNILSRYKTCRESSTLSLTDRRRFLILNGYTFNWIENHPEFLDLVENCQRAIDKNVHPQRISQGSSGSYFIKDESGGIVGIFKPKDEEPYGQLNPKWIKWLHRTCCPCLFGRSFLMPNTGYISEAAASLLDAFLGLNVVPRTQVVHLSSSAFYFPWWDHYKVWRERRKNPGAPYPLKLGSFQLYVEGFEDSSIVLAKLESLRPLEPELRKAYQLEFEKMTILDYAMRNTDRSMDNWLIHLSWIEENSDISANSEPLRQLLVRSAVQSNHNMKNVGGIVGNGSDVDLELLKKLPRLRPRVKIACIDNGMAFPFKHPHEVRSYPYSWAGLPESRAPYSAEIKSHLLPLLSDVANWETLVDKLRQIFKIDSDFNERVFQKQMAILRGQLYNIVESLRAGDSPIQLVHRPLLLIEEDETIKADEIDKGKRIHKHRHTPVSVNPLCTCW